MTDNKLIAYANLKNTSVCHINREADLLIVRFTELEETAVSRSAFSWAGLAF